MRYLLSLALVLALAAPASAAFVPDQPQARQGARAPQNGVTVQQALKMPDDSRVTLVGYIVSQVPGSTDRYVFRDNTGEIVVEIDREDFRGQTVTPRTQVRIVGEVDTHRRRASEIDVDYLEVIN